MDALTKLVNKHSGELVEVDVTRTGWKLVPTPPGSASDVWTEQWFCFPNGKEVDARLSSAETQQALEQWAPLLGGQGECHGIMGVEISRVLHSGSAKARTLSVNDLRADWLRQTFRVLAPCKGTKDFQWVRTGAVISLGQLFLVLGETFTAAEIYQFYRTLRIVAVKRRKQIKGHSPETTIPTHSPKHAKQ